VSNAVLQALISAKVSDLIAPPRSWGHAERVAFLNLPRDMQLFYSKREDQRDREVRRCQNEAAEARKTLAESQQLLALAESRIAELEATADHAAVEEKPDVPETVNDPIAAEPFKTGN
jgi:hypothetical protein